MENPFTDPTVDKSGTTEEILNSLTNSELETYISYLAWKQAHVKDSGPGPYRSAAYYRYRTSSWIQLCREILNQRNVGNGET
jgi:hypothetical protein